MHFCTGWAKTTLRCYKFDMPEQILIIFGRNVEKARNKMELYFPTSPNYYRYLAKPETKKLHLLT